MINNEERRYRCCSSDENKLELRLVWQLSCYNWGLTCLLAAACHKANFFRYSPVKTMRFGWSLSQISNQNALFWPGGKAIFFLLPDQAAGFIHTPDRQTTRPTPSKFFCSTHNTILFLIVLKLQKSKILYMIFILIRVNDAFELNWIKLNWIKLNWIKLNAINI